MYTIIVHANPKIEVAKLENTKKKISEEIYDLYNSVNISGVQNVI
jgi:hypothetical protein